MQEYFADTDRNIIMIAGNYTEIPLKDKCVDLFIDDFSVANTMLAYNISLIPRIQHWLTDECIAIGHFIDYSQAPKSLENFREDHPDFDPEMMSLKKLYSKPGIASEDCNNKNLKLKEVIVIGSTTGKQKDFVQQVGDEKVTVVAYMAEQIKC